MSNPADEQPGSAQPDVARPTDAQPGDAQSGDAQPGGTDAEGFSADGLDDEAQERRDELFEALEDFGQVGTEESLDGLLNRLDNAPVEEHADIYENLHSRLREMLDRDPSALPLGLVPTNQASSEERKHGGGNA